MRSLFLACGRVPSQHVLTWSVLWACMEGEGEGVSGVSLLIRTLILSD